MKMSLPRIFHPLAARVGVGLLAALLPLASDAGVALQVNGGTRITVNGGEALTFDWSATPDITYLRRSWGTAYDTQLPDFAGSESIHAPNPTVVTGFQYSVNGYDAAGQPVVAGVQVTVVPNPAAPAYTPITWTPDLGFFNYLTFSLYIVPDAVIGTPYFATIRATGVEPITYAAVNLPDGLTLVGNTIVGTPTTNALLKGIFTLIATDADGFTSAALARMMTPVLAPRVLTPVTAPVVFDGGAPELSSAYENDTSSGLGRAASGFTLNKSTTVTGIRVWGVYFARFKADTDNFRIRFFERGPSPIVTWPSFPAAGRQIASFTPTSVVRSQTGRAAYEVPNAEYVYDLSFAGLTLQSNTLYYVCVENSTQERWGIASSTIQNYPSWGAYALDGVTFDGGSSELAFQLKEGPTVVAPPPAPSPTTYKLDVKRNGKGTVTVTPTGSGSAGAIYAKGTAVTLTAAPDPADKSAVWKGWTGDVVSASRTISVTMSKNISVQANFR